MYCIRCGHQLVSGAKFCSNCGASVSEEPNLSSFSQVSIASSGSGDYRLILVDCDQCAKEDAEDLIVELLGYSSEDADQFVEMTPIEIAENLSALQARTLAQAFTECGCQMSIVNEQGDYIDLSEKATSSVFDDNGNLIAKAAAVLGALTLVNRVTSYRRHRKPSLLERLFKPRYQPRPVRRRKPSFSMFAPKPRPVAFPRHHVKPTPSPARHRPNHGHRPPHSGRRPR